MGEYAINILFDQLVKTIKSLRTFFNVARRDHMPIIMIGGLILVISEVFDLRVKVNHTVKS